MSYSTMTLARSMFWMFVCFALSVGALIWGYYGGASLIGGVRDFADSLTDVPKVLNNSIQEIDDALILQEWDPDTNGTKTNRLFQTTGNQTKKDADKARDDLDEQIQDSLGDYNSRVNQAQNAIWIAFIVPCALITIGTIAGLCNCRRFLPMAIVWFLFLFSFLIWVFHGIFSLAHYIFTDVCFEVDALSNERANIIPMFASCEDSQFSDFRKNFKSLEIEQAENTCNALLGTCFNENNDVLTNIQDLRPYSCPANLECTGITFAELLSYFETSWKIHPTIMSSNIAAAEEVRCRDTSTDCTVERCATDCLSVGQTYLSAIGLTSKQTYTSFVGAKQVSNAIDVLGSKYASCDTAFKIVIELLNPSRKKMVGGLSDIMNASGLLAFSMTVGLFVFVWGAKRFITFQYANVPLVDGEPLKETGVIPVVAAAAVSAAVVAGEVVAKEDPPTVEEGETPGNDDLAPEEQRVSPLEAAPKDDNAMES